MKFLSANDLEIFLIFDWTEENRSSLKSSLKEYIHRIMNKHREKTTCDEKSTFYPISLELLLNRTSLFVLPLIFPPPKRKFFYLNRENEVMAILFFAIRSCLSCGLKAKSKMPNFTAFQPNFCWTFLFLLQFWFVSVCLFFFFFVFTITTEQWA